jgi:hypothetical protein
MNVITMSVYYMYNYRTVYYCIYIYPIGKGFRPQKGTQSFDPERSIFSKSTGKMPPPPRKWSPKILVPQGYSAKLLSLCIVHRRIHSSRENAFTFFGGAPSYKNEVLVFFWHRKN